VKHSKIVGGSTAKRVINCPGSVALVDKMPPQPSSSYADEGTLLHDVIAKLLDYGDGADPQEMLGATYKDAVLTQDLLDRKILPALAALEEIDPNGEMSYATEGHVGFGDLLPGVFGSTDLLGRIGDRVILLDWKFGDGVAVEAEENEQLLFYAAAAALTEGTAWAFKDAKNIELIIVQPPYVRRWATTLARVKQFEQTLVSAVKAARKPDALLKVGSHCRWCAAKPICPQMTGAADRALAVTVEALPIDLISGYLDAVPLLELFIKDLQQLAHGLIEQGTPVPGYKLVNKRATRSWVDAEKAAAWLMAAGAEPYEEKIISPAAAEKVLKGAKIALPADLVVAVSSGSTLVAESDPRAAVVQIGQTLVKALAKLSNA
jgi:hypothetical protein